MKWDFKEKPELVCSNHHKTGEHEYVCNGHDYGCNLIPSHHGDPSRGHRFWVYGSGANLSNPWDYNVLPCDHAVYVGGHGPEEYMCLGHHLKFHGDPEREYKFWISNFNGN